MEKGGPMFHSLHDGRSELLQIVRRARLLQLTVVIGRNMNISRFFQQKNRHIFQMQKVVCTIRSGIGKSIPYTDLEKKIARNVLMTLLTVIDQLKSRPIF